MSVPLCFRLECCYWDSPSDDTMRRAEMRLFRTGTQAKHVTISRVPLMSWVSSQICLVTNKVLSRTRVATQSRGEAADPTFPPSKLSA